MASESVAALFARLPEGWSAVGYGGRRWGVSRTCRAGGRVETLYAEELGGTGVVSANLYLPGDADRDPDQAQLRPCEMPAADVLAFLRGWEPCPDASEGRREPPPEEAGRAPAGERRHAPLRRPAGE